MQFMIAAYCAGVIIFPFRHKQTKLGCHFAERSLEVQEWSDLQPVVTRSARHQQIAIHVTCLTFLSFSRIFLLYAVPTWPRLCLSYVFIVSRLCAALFSRRAVAFIYCLRTPMFTVKGSLVDVVPGCSPLIFEIVASTCFALICLQSVWFSWAIQCVWRFLRSGVCVRQFFRREQ